MGGEEGGNGQGQGLCGRATLASFPRDKQGYKVLERSKIRQVSLGRRSRQRRRESERMVQGAFGEKVLGEYNYLHCNDLSKKVKTSNQMRLHFEHVGGNSR